MYSYNRVNLNYFQRGFLMEKNVHLSPAEMDRQRAITNKIKLSLGDGVRYALVETCGCQQNVNDSQRIQGMLMEMG